MHERIESRLKAVAGHLGITSSTIQPSTVNDLRRKFPQADTARNFPEAVHDVMRLEELLTKEDIEIRNRVRQFMESEVAPIIADFWDRAEFPFHLISKLGQLGIGGLNCSTDSNTKGLSLIAAGLVCAEVSRVDCSLCTFLLVHASLAMASIEMLGSDAQQKELLPKMAQLDLVGCWALTEPNHGSDASSISTTASKVEGGYLLNGRKRWIGNGTFADILVIWARNSQTNKVNAFIVRKGSKGLRTTKIENKIALRCVQNADIEMRDVFVPEADRLPGVDSFEDTNKILTVSRLMVVWQPVGVASGVYDMAVRYTKHREQFGAPIGGFQLVQERLVRMQATVQAMTLFAWRLTTLQEQGKMTHGMVSSAKAWNTLRGREVVALGREVLGGNGVVTDFHIAKAFCDAEALYTYEGTYDVNCLVSGREITGVAAIKPRQQRTFNKPNE